MMCKFFFFARYRLFFNQKCKRVAKRGGLFTLIMDICSFDSAAQVLCY